jgi:hypothetical protein
LGFVASERNGKLESEKRKEEERVVRSVRGMLD